MRLGIIGGLLLLMLTACAQGSGCDLVKVTQVPLEARGRLFTVPATIDGHKLSMLMDTGGARSMLDEAVVRRLKIPQDGRTFTVLVGLSGGSPKADANVQTMLLGDVPLSVDRIPVNTFGGTRGIDGILGLDILRDYDLDIDAPNGTLTLYRVRQCEHADPPWSEPAIPVNGVATRASWMEIPFEIDGVTGTGAVDTGASFTAIMPRMMRRLGLTEQAMAGDKTVKLHVIAGEDVQAHVHRFETIKIGPVTAHNTSILVLSREPPALGGGRQFDDGVIGQDLLHTRRVWFSMRTGRLYMSGGGNSTPAERATSGH